MQTEKIAVYDSSRLIAVFKADPKTAWSAGVHYVRSMAHCDGFSGVGEWYRTANREVYAMGQFRCLPAKARR